MDQVLCDNHKFNPLVVRECGAALTPPMNRRRRSSTMTAPEPHDSPALPPVNRSNNTPSSPTVTQQSVAASLLALQQSQASQPSQAHSQGAAFVHPFSLPQPSASDPPISPETFCAIMDDDI